METNTGILGRVAEHILKWAGFALLVLAGFALYQMGPQGRGALWSFIWRLGLWLAVAAALPWAAQWFMRQLLSLSTNWAGFILIAAVCVLDVVAGIVLKTSWPAGPWSWLGVLALLGAAGTYNYLVAEYLAEQAGG
jgi:hypothetical protein